ncbi:hypothetical protein A4X13_0g5834 [Tilletia indica]|uniref:THIF-type NAD/FAD binding fold domain-containing protein n=1 Tax=Tilletia indica TaxID=43049 RepID=A0A177TFM9_9BASI|nr:hypothetical protein A4X13_0g5834 [Tilletia indica]
MSVNSRKDQQQLVIVAAATLTSSALTAIAIFTYQSHTRKQRRRALQDKVKRATNTSHDTDIDIEPDQQQQQQPSSPTPSSSTTATTPRYLSQLQLQAAAAAASHNQRFPHQSHNHHSSARRNPIPPPLLPKPHRTSSSSSLRSTTSTTTLTSASAHPSPSPAPRPSTPTQHGRFSQSYPESLIREQLARHYSFFSPSTLQQQRSYLLQEQLHPSSSRDDDDDQDGEAIEEGTGMPAIRSAYIIIVGLGGVGSHAALALLRSGISHLRLIDFDQVSLSSLNRHACATLADVGRSKVLVCQEKFGAIAPWANVEAVNELFRGSEAVRLLTGPRKPDYIIDAIDNIDTKVDLLAFAYNNDIRIITASGAGAKSDPSRIQIADLSATSEDPLARAVRRRLRMIGVPRLRDKLGDGHGSVPRARTLKKREKAAAALGDDEAIVQSPAPLSSQEQDADFFSTPDPSPQPTDYPPQSSTGRPIPSPARITHSRRASSTSSMGNARYVTPMMSPSELREESGSMMMGPPALVLEAALEEEQEQEQEQQEETHNEAQEEKKPKGTPYSKTRKSHSHALTQSSLALASLQTSTTTGHRLTIPCVFSTEKSDVRLLDLPASEVGRGKIEELAALEDFRVRVLPVLGPIPAIFGMSVAAYVLCEIAGWPMEPLPFLNRRKMYEKMLSDLEVVERKYPYPHSTTTKLPFSLTDITYLTEEVFHSRSCIPPFSTLTTAASLMRWDSTLPLGFNNVVLLEREEGKVHAREVLKGGRSPWEVWGREAAEEVKRRMVAERRMGVFR